MSGCLPNIRVLDMSRVFAGPWAGQMLADLGAEVIKIEHPVGGDEVRRLGLPQKDAAGKETGETSSYLAMNRNKKSITLDIGKPEGQALMKRLVAESDVLIENFKAGGLEKYGLDYASLSAVNPKLVYCSITGFGQAGPYSALPGYDSVFQAMSGLMSITGSPDDPALVGYSVSDINAGFYAIIAILAALHHRDMVSGKGQHIDLALLDAQIGAQSHIAMNFLVSGKMPVRAGAASQITAPWQAFECADRALMIAVGNDRQFASLCGVLGIAEAGSDPRYASNRQRMANKATLMPLLSSRFATKDAGEWMELLAEAGVASGPINNFEKVFEDPQVVHRGMKMRMAHPLAGEMEMVANPLRFSETPVEYRAAPPLHGQHTRAVLREVLALDDAALDALAAAKAI